MLRSANLRGLLGRASSVSVIATLVSLAGLAALAGGCATSSGAAAHVPRTGLKAADYYPLAQGWKWAYDLEQSGEKILAIYAVTESTPEGATVTTGGEQLSYAITPDGIAQADASGVGDFVLKNPITKGASWPVASGTATVISTTEEITLDAGHFYDCALVEVVRADPPRITRTLFAPDVGPVKIEVQVQQEGGKYATQTSARLRSVTKPGEDLFGSSPAATP
jgi:hypothetical protein